MPYLFREVNSKEEGLVALSYIEDLGIKRPKLNVTDFNADSDRLHSTIAMYRDGHTRYPEAMFMGTKQVFPPIVKASLNNLHTLGSSEDIITFSMSHDSSTSVVTRPLASATDFVMEQMFTMSYMVNFDNVIHNAKIPSFDPENPPAGCFAYASGNNIYIRDPNFSHFIIPTRKYMVVDSTDPSLQNHAVVTMLKVTPDAEGIAASQYDTTYAPIIYNNVNGTYRIRRSGEAADWMNVRATSIPRRSTYTNFRAWVGQTPIDETHWLAIEPKLDPDVLPSFNPFYQNFTTLQAYPPALESSIAPCVAIDARVLNVFLIACPTRIPDSTTFARTKNIVNCGRDSQWKVAIDGIGKDAVEKKPVRLSLRVSNDESDIPGDFVNCTANIFGEGVFASELSKSIVGELWAKQNPTDGLVNKYPKFLPSIAMFPYSMDLPMNTGQNIGFVEYNTVLQENMFTIDNAEFQESGSAINEVKVSITFNENVRYRHLDSIGTTAYSYFYFAANMIAPYYSYVGNDLETSSKSTLKFAKGLVICPSYFSVKGSTWTVANDGKYLIEKY